MGPPKSFRIRKAFAALADTLTADFDIIDFLDNLCHDAADLLSVAACGIVLADHAGTLGLVAASTEQARVLELSQLRDQQGPSLESYRTRTPVTCEDLASAGCRWPAFGPATVGAGFSAVHAIPMFLREDSVGAVSLYAAEPGALDAEAAELGQALADVATIGILHRRAVVRHKAVTEQLQAALNSRIVIEQAKGMLAERLKVRMDDAFSTLRCYARSHNLKLADAARGVTEGTLVIPQQ